MYGQIKRTKCIRNANSLTNTLIHSDNVVTVRLMAWQNVCHNCVKVNDSGCDKRVLVVGNKSVVTKETFDVVVNNEPSMILSVQHVSA